MNSAEVEEMLNDACSLYKSYAGCIRLYAGCMQAAFYNRMTRS